MTILQQRRGFSVNRIFAVLGNGRVKNPDQPLNVVITGSTKGVGLSMAKEFLDCGDRVVITSRTDESVEETKSSLGKQYGTENVKGMVCDVTKPDAVSGLANFSAQELGTIDIWINNAGTNAYQYNTITDSADADLIRIVETNLLGVMFGCREAIRIMRDQQTDGHIFNMEGAGSNGRPTPRFAAYGATKRAIKQLNESLVAELELKEIKNIGVHILSPGMCTTELLMSGANTPTAKFFINCLAEPPDIPAKDLVPKIRRVPKEARGLFGLSQNLALEYLTTTKAFTQIFKRLASGERKGRYVPEDD